MAGVGVESGVVKVGPAYYDFAACSIYDGHRHHSGFSSMFALPPRVSATFLDKGYNDAFAEAFELDPDPKGGGVLDQMSEGVLSRPKQMQEAVDAALLRLFATDFYDDSTKGKRANDRRLA